MSKRSRKRRAKRGVSGQYAPKPGPGDVYVREFVSARTGREERYRNIGEHPLTLAHARGKITGDQFAAGEILRCLCALRGASGRDSTEITASSGGGERAGLTETQIDAIRRLERLRNRLKTRDWTMLEKFCGEGWSMAEAVRAATVCHPSGVVLRMQEALDELASALGARVARAA